MLSADKSSNSSWLNFQMWGPQTWNMKTWRVHYIHVYLVCMCVYVQTYVLCMHIRMCTHRNTYIPQKMGDAVMKQTSIGVQL